MPQIRRPLLRPALLHGGHRPGAQFEALQNCGKALEPYRLASRPSIGRFRRYIRHLGRYQQESEVPADMLIGFDSRPLLDNDLQQAVRRALSNRPRGVAPGLQIGGG